MKTLYAILTTIATLILVMGTMSLSFSMIASLPYLIHRTPETDEILLNYWFIPSIVMFVIGLISFKVFSKLEKSQSR